MGGGLRYFSAAVAFAFAAVWIMASLAGALVCLAAAAAGYAAVFAVERVRSKLAARRESPGSSTPRTLVLPSSAQKEELLLSPDELNRDLGYVYEPGGATTPLLPSETEYGWPTDDESPNRPET